MGVNLTSAILILVLTATVTAQEPSLSSQAQPSRALSLLSAVSSMSLEATSTLDPDAQQPAKPAQPPAKPAQPPPKPAPPAKPAQPPAKPAQPAANPAQPPARAARRRGSMVGYIDDARVDSKVRIRVDSASDNKVPDRAEFFYAKCGCFGGDAPGPPSAASDIDFNQVDIFGEWALGVVSVFGQLPMRWIQPQSFISGTGTFPNQSGMGDLRGGFRVALADSDVQSLTVQAQFYTPTGDPSHGLGTNHASFEPALLYYRRLSDVAVIESQFGVWFPLGGSAGDLTLSEEKFSGEVLNFGVGAGFEVYRSSRIMLAPVVELVGWWVMSGLQTVPTPGGADGAEAAEAAGTIVNFKIGGRVSIDDLHSIYVGYGHALTDQTWYRDIVRLEYRYSF